MVRSSECEFVCEGCGANVIQLGMSHPPANGFCAVCGFISEYVKDPDEFDAMRRRANEILGDDRV
jgi:hypothetical protein